MNYRKIYDNLIDKVKMEDRNKKQGFYFEKHHILPKCLGGGNEKNNLILLTAKEHFICHKLLIEIYPNNSKMIYSLWMMVNVTSGNQERYKISSREYDKIKKLMSEIKSNEISPFKGKKHTEETKRKNSEKHIGKISSNETKKKLSDAAKGEKSFWYGKNRTDEVKNKISNSKTGQKHTDISKRKMSESHKGFKHTEESKEKMSISKKGKKKSKEAIENRKKSIIGKYCGENNKLFGIQRSDEVKKKISDSLKGRKLSEETKQKLSSSHQNKPLIYCPHCNYSNNNMGNMKKNHFDNCKLKKIKKRRK